MKCSSLNISTVTIYSFEMSLWDENHRTTEGIPLSWKGATRTMESSSWPSTRHRNSNTMCLTACSKCFFNSGRSGACEHGPGEPVPVPNHPLGGKPVPDIQPKPSLTQLHVISFNPITCHESEENGAIYSKVFHCPLLLSMLQKGKIFH